MKAITLHQPYASLVAHGLKKVETRGWDTSHRGPVAIHAAVKWDRGVQEAWSLWVGEHAEQLGFPLGAPPLGCVVAVARLIEVRLMTADLIGEQTALELSAGDWQAGRFAWALADVERLLVPVPAKGFQQLWNLPAAVEDQVRQRAKVRA